MSIIYEDDSHCLNCWPVNNAQGSSSAKKMSLAQKLGSQPPLHKISLKKQTHQSKKKSMRRLTEHKPSIDTLESTVHFVEQRQELAKPSQLSQNQVLMSQTPRTKKSLSFSQKTKGSRKTSLKPQTCIEMTKQNDATHFPQASNHLQTTLKTCQRQPGKNQLTNTIKTIPKNTRSLFELSKMKKSIMSIVEPQGPQERFRKPRIEESDIIIDFFKANSQLTELAAVQE